jgi:acyl carrier protein
MSDYLQTIKKTISDKVGLDVTEITKDSFFEEDLNISELELIEILEELEEKFHTELVGERENILSVNDLVDLLTEQLE